MASHQQKDVIDSISKACAYGDFDRLRTFVESDPSCVNSADDQGYLPLQWAALNNRVAECTYLLSNGAAINAQDGTGQTSMHWAAVRGSLPVMETLLRHGADVSIPDNRGYTVCHVAAQYGQTAVLYHLALKWGVDIDAPDTDGRTPLHWAAYKGFPDTLRLLLVLDARHTLADKEGCTALHWAAIKGNGEACTVLIQGGSATALTARDVTGSTPAQLAVEKGHRLLGLHLSEVRAKAEDAWFGRQGRAAWLNKLQLCPVIWALILALLVVFVTRIADNGPEHRLGRVGVCFAWSVVVVAGVGLVFLHKCTTADPGFVPLGWDAGRAKRDKKLGSSGGKGNGGGGGAGLKGNDAGGVDLDSMERGKLLERSGSGAVDGRAALDSPALWAGNWSQLCATCKIVRPLRAKHCGVTDRCVEVFDHYCPWVGNTIGKGNRHWFLVFLWLEVYALLVSSTIAGYQMWRHLNTSDWTPATVWTLLFVCIDGFLAMSVVILAVAQASQVARNVTTNELANWHRYSYLHGPDNRFHNPFNRGLKKNCIEAFWPQSVPTCPVFMQPAPESRGVSGKAGAAAAAYGRHSLHQSSTGAGN